VKQTAPGKNRKIRIPRSAVGSPQTSRNSCHISTTITTSITAVAMTPAQSQGIPTTATARMARGNAGKKARVLNAGRPADMGTAWGQPCWAAARYQPPSQAASRTRWVAGRLPPMTGPVGA
jgi:hypothetical protein